MPEFDFNTEIPLGRTRDLLAEQKPSAASSLLSDAYGWAMDNKLAAAAAVGVAALGGYALFRGGLGNVGAKADALGAGQRFAAQEAPALGGRMLGRQAAPVLADDAFSMGQRALSAPLHEIPTFAPTLRGDFLPKSAVRLADQLEAKLGLRFLGK